MTTSDDRRSPGSRPADALDAFLDDLTYGDRSGRHALAPDIADTARRLQGLADATLAANIAPGDEARTWEALMRGRPSRPQLVTRPFAVRAPPSQTVTPIPPSRLRRVGSQSLGLVATLTLVALIGLSGLAVYLTAPRRDDPATAAVVAAASPTAIGTPAVPADARVVHQINCTVVSQDYDTLMGTIWEETLNSFARMSPDQALTQRSPVTPVENATVPGGFSYLLPAGPTPDDGSVEAVTGVLGMFHQCGSMEQASLSTINRYVRFTLDQSSRDGSSFPFIALWRDAQGLQPERPPGNPVGPPRYQLYGLRMLDDQHLGAYLAPAGDIVVTDQNGRYEIREPRFDQRAYVVFERQDDGRWLIDVISDLPPELSPTCGSTCATPST